jgi:glutaredoxin-related protein
MENSIKSGKSSAILDLLKQNGIVYTPYDIADGNHLSHWLKHYTHAHAFPQLFAEGKFVGDGETCI